MAIAPKQLVVFFQRRNGNPYEGGTPSIIIWEVNPIGGSPHAVQIVNGTILDEIGGGFYKYDFPTYDNQKKYTFRVDGEEGPGPNLGSGRFVVGTNEAFTDDIAYDVWEEPADDHKTGSPQTFGALVNAIATGTLGSPQGSGPSFTVPDIVQGVWSAILTGSPQPFAVGAAGTLLKDISESTLALQGSPTTPLTVSNIVTNVWNELILGSPQPYPVGTAAGVLKLVSETSGLTQTEVRSAVWNARAEDYALGSPITMGHQLDDLYGKLQRKIWIDSQQVGSPMGDGSQQKPFKNLTDVIAYSNQTGLDNVFVVNSLTLSSGDVSNFHFTGDSFERSVITVTTGANTTGATFINCDVTGSFTAGGFFEHCMIRDVTATRVHAFECALNGTITLTGVDHSEFVHCEDGNITGTSVIDFSNTAHVIIFKKYSGNIILRNKSQPENITMDLATGTVILEPTVTAGLITARGTGRLIDNSVGATVNTNWLLQASTAHGSSLVG